MVSILSTHGKKNSPSPRNTTHPKAGAGAKGADDAADAAKSSAKQSDDATKADAHERADADSSAATGEGTTQWDDPAKVQEWHDELPTRIHPPSTPAYEYQHRVLETDIERQLPVSEGKTIWADSVTVEDGGVAMAWDAKYTEGGDKALYHDGRPDFLMRDFDKEVRRYRKVIESSDNPVSTLNLVTNTPEAVEFLGQRARDILGPDIDLVVHFIP